MEITAIVPSGRWRAPTAPFGTAFIYPDTRVGDDLEADGAQGGREEEAVSSPRTSPSPATASASAEPP
jgi:hypothetical protein